MLINSKMGKGIYLLDKEHLPLLPEFEDNEDAMDASHPTSIEAREKREKAKAENATQTPHVLDASALHLMIKQD